MKETKADRIRAYLLANPDAVYCDVSRMFGVNRGYPSNLARQIGYISRISFYSNDEELRLKQLVAAGCSDAEIGRQIGRSRASVWIKRVELGLAPAIPGVVFSDAQRKKAVHLVKRGMSFGEAALATGMTRSAVAGAVNRTRQKQAA